MTATTVYRPPLNVVQPGGSISIVDDGGNVRQVIGTQPDGSVTIVDQNGPPPPTPSTPAVTAVADGLTVRWDGNLSLPAPADFDHVEIHVSETLGFTPDATTLQGQLRKAGIFPLAPLGAGTTYYVALVGVNTSGVPGPASPEASGVPTAVVAAELEDGIVDTLALADDAVTEAKIDAAAVTETKIADDAVTSPKIVANAIETEHIAAGAVDAASIAANAITADKLVALSVTAAKIAANTITAGQIAAGAITADLLAATLVLASEIIAGDPAATRVQIDATGLNAYDADDNATVSINSDGSAAFTGSSVSASEVDAERLIINSASDGGVFMYGSDTSAPLNGNPTLAAGTSSWTSTATLITYSATHTYQGHNTMRATRASGPATVESLPFTVLAGSNYQLFISALTSATTPFYCSIRWLNSAGTEIGSVTSPSSTSTSFTALAVAGIAPTGAVSAKIRIGFTVSGGNDAFYVGYAAVTVTNVVTSLTNNAGTDDLGNPYPAGLQTSAANVGRLTAGNIKTGVVTQATSTNGRVSFPNPFASNAARFCYQMHSTSGSGGHGLQEISVSLATVTIQVVDTTDGSNAASGQTVTFSWIGIA